MAKQNYLKGIGGEPISPKVDWTPPKRSKRKKGRIRNETPIAPNALYDAQVKWEHEENERKQKISSYIDQNDWKSVESYLKKLLLLKKSWIRETMLFAQSVLVDKVECPDAIHDIVKEALERKKRK